MVPVCLFVLCAERSTDFENAIQTRQDWGGVSQDWFRDSASNNTYNWNVNPDSLIFEDDTIFRERYHVFMLKEGQRET
jgi:hypothetical protein